LLINPLSSTVAFPSKRRPNCRHGEDLQTEVLVRNLPGFARFLPVADSVHELEKGL